MAVSINEGVRYPVSVAPQAAVTHPNFRGADTVSSSNVLKKSPSTDIVEISSKKEKKKGLSTGAKWGIGLGITALGALAIYGLTRGKAKPKKQFWDNIKEVQVEKDLKFTEFKDKNEALKFAKEKLKLENIDENMSVEALNDIIDTFIDIANKNNGKIVVPHKITQEATDKYFASVAGDIKDNNFGTLTINKDLYDVKKLEENLKSQLFKDGAPIYSWNNNGNLAQGFLVTENIPIYPEDLSLLKSLVQDFHYYSNYR